MSKAYKIHIWKKAPMLRLVVPLMLGILLELYGKFAISGIIIAGSTLIIAYIIFRCLPLVYRFKLRGVAGIIITLFMIIAGVLFTWQKDVRNHAKWYGNRVDSSAYIIATISEPLVERNKSYKALAKVDAVIEKNAVYPAEGKVLLYFSKDSDVNTIVYGDRIVFKNNLQEIKNSGNPAAFDYKGYCASRQIYHQCYLKRNDLALLNGRDASFFKQLIFSTQDFVINVLNKYITGPDESALAKALLIGYKVDLDKDLVQAYGNAGVIHLIVIAGLHLGLIYTLLLWVTGLISFFKKSKIARLFLILSCLWFFALITGASPPILRAVVMFSFIAGGKAFNKNASIFNSLSSSAFLLLCYDPFILKDAGFQLSYLAVTSIVISQRYIYHWFYFTNKLARKVWELASVSLSAQVFTLPACLYYFHQVPLLFMVSNIIAIPLAAFALWGCLLLVFISPLKVVAIYLGKIISASIWLLNHVVLFINALPFSLWSGFSISVAETILLYLVVSFFLYWLIKKNNLAFKYGICATLLFTLMVTFKKWDSFRQKKIIVYNIPAHKAVDFISGNNYYFMGDSDLVPAGLLQNFNLKPARISMIVHNSENAFPVFQNKYFVHFYGKRILLIDSPFRYKPLHERMAVDYIIISKNPKIFIPDLAAVFNCNMYIFDASNTLWKIDKWKKDCEELHLLFYSVPEQGAFIMDL